MHELIQHTVNGHEPANTFILLNSEIESLKGNGLDACCLL